MKTTKKTATATANANATATKATSNKAKATKATALDPMEQQIAKAERLAKIEQRKAERLANATERFQTLRQGNDNTKGFANVTLSTLHTHNAMNASVQGAIDTLNAFIKNVASANGLAKNIVASLKGEAAKTLLQQVNETTLPLYIDNKGNYKVETLYRLVASKAKNSELRQLLNNLKKQDK